MANRDIARGRRYHDLTKHSYWSVRHNAHSLDWPNQPIPFKLYNNLEVIRLAGEFPPLGVTAVDAIAAGPDQPSLGLQTEDSGGSAVGRRDEQIPDTTQLSRILYFSGGITRRRQYPGGEILFRAAACTGALYEIELYVVCGDLPGLSAGVYHWSPADMALRRLRQGDYRGVVAEATASERSVCSAPVIVICTGTYWRNAWKYQARTYRHFGWDNGTLLANLLAVSAALRLSAKLLQGFVDSEINRLLDLNAKKEVAFSIVALGRTLAATPASPKDLPPLNYETEPLSKNEVDYPAMREMHDASSLKNADEVAEWRQNSPRTLSPEPEGKLFPLRPPKSDEAPGDTLEEVILRRGSSRRFARAPLTFAQLSTILDRATGGIPADFLQPWGTQINDLYLIVHAVDELPSGSYFFHRERQALELLKQGDFRDDAGYLGLEQQLPADAAAAIFYLADLKAIFESFGNRGYRAVQTEAGMIGGKIYLSAYAQHLGASGLTFYDDDVVKFFSPHAEGKSAIFLTAVGKRMRRQ